VYLDNTRKLFLPVVICLLVDKKIRYVLQLNCMNLNVLIFSYHLHRGLENYYFHEFFQPNLRKRFHVSDVI
jgi:hypothetical protein